MSTQTLVLVLNSGSSSVKFQLIDVNTESARSTGIVEHIGEQHGPADHSAALAEIFAELHSADEGFGQKLLAIGHRVVHGGTQFSKPTVLSEDDIVAIEKLSVLAPLHNPAAVTGIRAAQQLAPNTPQVAVFDTAFYASLPPASSTYAIDRSLAETFGIRRYGFHGTSHDYVSHRAATFLGKRYADLNLIVLHLGNGASASAISGGKPVDTSMGLTPLEGLVMGTRPGDIDPAIPLYLQRVAELSADDVDALLNRKSGLLGLSGVNDFRELRKLIEGGDENATLAYDVYIQRLKKYVGAYYAELGTVDAIVFTAGVGEHDPGVRADALSNLTVLGIEVDSEKNRDAAKGERAISAKDSAVAVLVIPTNEELAIARAAAAAV